MRETSILPTRRANKYHLCENVSGKAGRKTANSYIREILRIDLFVVVQVDIVACVTKEHDQENVIELVISSRLRII